MLLVRFSKSVTAMSKVSGNIEVIEPQDDYKRIHKSIIKNRNIDCVTLGLYAKIVVLGAEWQLNIKGLSTLLGLSDAKVRKSVVILEREGYIRRDAIYHDGKLAGWNYKIYPEPIPECERSKAGYKKEVCEPIQCCAESSVTEKQTTLETVMTEKGEDISINRLNQHIDLINSETISKENKEKNIDKSISQKKADFARWWSLYDKKIGRAKCYAKWLRLTDEERALCIANTPRYVASTPNKQYRKHPLTYLNGECWNDEIVVNNNATLPFGMILGDDRQEIIERSKQDLWK